MSEVRLVICDALREIQGTPHGGFADRVIAALSAEPETIEELDAALERFMTRHSGPFFRGFSPFCDQKSHDAGLVIVDLAARLVVCESTYSAATEAGIVAYHDGTAETDVGVRYHLSDDWLLTSDASDWRALAEKRRLRRASEPPLDVRSVIYGEPLLQFIARETFAAFHRRGAPAKAEWGDPAYQREYKLVEDIHARWMMTPVCELRDHSPREVMLAKRDFISADLQDRETQWSFMEQCPPGLDRDSAAYRLGGFGTHEMVVYYDLVRELLWACRQDVAERCASAKLAGKKRERFIAEEVDRLAELREWWLDAPEPEFDGRTPRSIIDNERARIPEAMSGEESIVDPDCPLCQMQAEMPGPVFWHLDGSHMDDDFAFSLWHESQEEWESEQHQHEEFSRRFELIRAEEERLGVRQPEGRYVNPDLIWQMSFSTRHCSQLNSGARLFAIGQTLCELLVDLRESFQGASGESGMPLGRDDLIGGLREAFQGLRESVEPADSAGNVETIKDRLQELRDRLDAATRACPELASECCELRDRLYRFLEAPREMDDEEVFQLDALPC